ncbi:MAG TPA: methyltransferase [Xanthobacteraceae bacterium]|jgi:tRNA1(Val) A37 N6-methylase TrmN6|nr:methyltransferase [Xanthobacteraceae bacterium]
MPAEVTEDAVLGGKLRLKQPTGGHRFGHDAILLAAACPARAGERVVDLGAGVGAAGLALALRVAGTNVVLVEIDAALAALAAENAQLNALAARVSSLVLDVAAPASAFAAAGLESESAARVLMNPPFNDPARQRASPDRQRRLAHAGSAETLRAWIKAAARLLRLRGTVTMIWRADRLAEVLLALASGFGAATVLPVHPNDREPAVRVLVRATKGSRAPLVLLPGFVLNDRAGCPTSQARSVLRGDTVLPLSEI